MSDNKLKYVFEVIRYGVSFTAIKEIINRYLWYIHDHIAPLARMNIAGNTRIHPTASLRCGENIYLGQNSHINYNCCIWASENAKIILGDNLLMGPGVKIFASNHMTEYGKIMNTQPWVEKDINIGNDVWLGANTVVVAGVTIEEGCVVAAGAVVIKNIPKYSIVGGIPAKVIGQRKQHVCL